MDYYLFDLLDHLASKQKIVSLEISRNVNFILQNFINYFTSNYDIILVKLLWSIYWFILVPGVIILIIIAKYFPKKISYVNHPNNQHYDYVYARYFYEVFLPYERLILYFTLNYTFYETEQQFSDYWDSFENFIITKNFLGFSRGSFILNNYNFDNKKVFDQKLFYYQNYNYFLMFNFFFFCDKLKVWESLYVFNTFYERNLIIIENNETELESEMSKRLDYINSLTMWERHLHHYMYERMEDMKLDFKGYWDELYFLVIPLLNEEEDFAKRFLLPRNREFKLPYLNKFLVQETGVSLFLIFYWSEKVFFNNIKCLDLVENEDYSYNDNNILEWLLLGLPVR